MERSFDDVIQQIPISSIKVAEGRQRKELKDIGELATSIKTTGLIQPVVIIAENSGYTLVAGERRLRAFELLVLQGSEVHKNIPCRVLQSTDEQGSVSLKLIELEENLKRSDLTWKEQVFAVKDLVETYQGLYKDWAINKVCEVIGYDYSWVIRCIKIARALIAENPLVINATGIQSASNILSREQERKQTTEMDKLVDDLSTGREVRAGAEEERHSRKELLGNSGYESKSVPDISSNKASIIQGNFCNWAETYDGPKFNFIHCDFPYGLDHGNSDQGGAKQWGAYEDSEDTYWLLCSHLLMHRDKLMLNSCHILFWFAMKYYRETIDFFSKHAPEIEVQQYPLIWHKSDNRGIAPDVARQPRRVYETALLMSRGDRKIIKPISNTISAPSNKADAIHISEKPVPVLNHFFSMLVDDGTRVLDPTCGGGTAIRSADGLGAEMALGIELDELYAQAAQKKLKQAQTLEAASEIVSQE